MTREAAPVALRTLEYLGHGVRVIKQNLPGGMRMVDEYGAEGTLEGNQLIRLKAPLPFNDGPVKVIVTPQTKETGSGDRNRAALEALDNLLAQPDDLTPSQWVELERIIEEHPLRTCGTPTA